MEHRCSKEEWAAFVRIGDLEEIASPRFARLAKLARDEGLLEAMLVNDSEEVVRRVSELSTYLAALIRSQYQPTQSSR